MTARTAPPRVGRLARWKLTEPLRLYVYGWSLLLGLVLVLVGAVSGEWPAVVLAVVALLFLAPALEAARRSCYSPRGTVTAIRDSHL